MNNKDHIDDLFAKIEAGKTAENELDNIGIFIFDILKEQYKIAYKQIVDLFVQYSNYTIDFNNLYPYSREDYYDSLVKVGNNKFIINTTDRDGVASSTSGFPIEILYMDMDSGEMGTATMEYFNKQFEEFINNSKLRDEQRKKDIEQSERAKYEELKKKFEANK